jgi:hypothetical protein
LPKNKIKSPFESKGLFYFLFTLIQIIPNSDIKD